MPALRCLALCLGAASLPSLAFAEAAPTRSIAANVLSSNARVPADGATWTVWWVGDGCDASRGYPGERAVGSARFGYAVGEVGALLSRPPAAGDLWVFLAEQTGALGGWYAINDTVVGAMDPQPVGAATLRPIPVPISVLGKESARVSWSPAAEDSRLGPHVVGYHVWRRDGESAPVRLTDAPVGGRVFLDHAALPSSRYSISLALRGAGCPVASAGRSLESAPFQGTPRLTSPPAAEVSAGSGSKARAGRPRSFVAYPNPTTSGAIGFALPGDPGTRYLLKITDLSGALIAERQVESPDASLVLPLAPGVYLATALALSGHEGLAAPLRTRFARANP